MADPDFRTVAIVGLGLIGGSLAAGIKANKLASHVIAYDSNEESLKQGLSLGLIDECAENIEAASQDADLVVLAVPVQSLAMALGELKDFSGVITDVGSVKSVLIDAAESMFGEMPVNLVPGHPIAGSEKHGVSAADAGLFKEHKVILTPVAETDSKATAKVRGLWEQMGAEVVEMDPVHHDAILAQTSHLPHLLAYALVDTLSGRGDSLEIFEYAAGGFRDFSRIAASDPVMWRDIFEANGEPVLEVLDRYVNELKELRNMIESGNTEALEEVFTRAKAARDHFSSLQVASSKGKAQ